MFFNKIGTLAVKQNLTFMGANTTHLVQWFIEQLLALKEINSVGFFLIFKIVFYF